ncbi:MAG: sugar phosphate isomerase/epimerase [Lachnospiraceae bacterium]|nr:sugar phosphate isomerase/epimerase [Lachnospiraceae bacterium]
MQIGIRLHDVRKAPLAERLATAHEQGFSCAHLALTKVISENPVDDGALTPGYAMYLRKLFAEHELDIAVLGCYLNLATPNAVSLAKTTKRYMTNIRFASLLGAGVVGTETGAPNEDYRFEEACHTDEALETFIRNVRPVVEYAEKMGVILAIEPVYRHIVCNPKRARKVLDAIGSPNLQIIFDPVNLLDMDNYRNSDEIFAEAIDLFGEDVAVMHLKDYRIENGQLISTAAGTGEMDYSRIIRFMKERKPYIHATLEDTVPENAVQARMHIQKLWDACEV